MTGKDIDSRIWAIKDRTRTPRQHLFAKRMRRQPTEAERKLWWHLRHRLSAEGTHFRRQVQIGSFIADFVCHDRKIVIEVDGGQYSTANEDLRTDRMEADSYRVLRFWNNDVLSNVDGVLVEIQSALAMTPTLDPSPQGGGEKKAQRAR